MHQVLLDVRSGEVRVQDVPPPRLAPGGVLVRTHASVLSVGTERNVVDLASKSLIGKAQARPDLVRRVIEKGKTEGWLQTLESVRNRLDTWQPLGYSAAGVVQEVGREVTGLRQGDRVAIAGHGYASHAEVNFVPKNLVAAIPDGVTFEDAAYTTVCAIALQGVRLSSPNVGEFVAVIGLGLVGLVTVQLLAANGCRVIGIDPMEERCRLGLATGLLAACSPGEAQDAVDRVTSGRGVDHTLIAAATSSNDPITMAGEITRRKGNVVVLGAVGMEIPRATYYAKELTVQVSRSLGPGRYDPSYEEGGFDYPYEYVRWTEGRNMEAALSLMADGRIDLSKLTTHRFPIADASAAYEQMQSDGADALGIVLTYPHDRDLASVVKNKHPKAPSPHAGETVGVSFIGAGNYATGVLLPIISGIDGAHLQGVVTSTGASAERTSRKFGFQYATTDADVVLNDDRTDVVFIATRHGSHAELTRRALESGKHVFVEKPLVTTEDDLEVIARTIDASSGRLMVGLNRRFAPMIKRAKDWFPETSPMQIVYRVNAGSIAPDAWMQASSEGGGMLVGEMIHFVDVMLHLTGEQPISVYAKSSRVGMDTVNDDDNVVITIGFDKGSVGTIAYNTVGSRGLSKERIEVFGSGCAVIIDDFRRLEYTKNGTKKADRSRQDKGQRKMIAAWLDCLRHGTKAPIGRDEIVAGMKVIFRAIDSLRTEEAISLKA